ncbi:T9SS type A sorting domain-containing protein [Olleya sp. HaHaR_3_96]|uniref:T9SS type A sorting domain-containing protein n=1 Tax=Olleya sp. HaHaR_3_96 TaxID=2745560 RepID=UPI001C4EF4F9|nr:T9SS type A sorting domain-containing protein [Olleya sp. HaHaR_3_96]QXP61430.1 T9SS type A sorting domain-containing protein [Olleya sp. HaHaR_3_96]
MKNKLLYLLIYITTNSLFGQTNVSGGIFSNTTWDINGSPYTVTSDIALYPGYTLTIEPGVTVKFNDNTKMLLRGLLIASGTPENKIIFIASFNNPVGGGWQGIEVENNQGGKIIASNIIGEYAYNFIRIMNSSSGEILNISNSEIKNCNYAFYGYDGDSNHTVILDNLNVHNNDYGYIFGQNITLTNSVFSDGEKGIHSWASIPNIFISNSEFFNFSIWPFNMEGEIDNCHIHDNAVGIRMREDLIVKNSTIEFNTIGISAVSSSPVSGANIFDNKICDNTQYNFKHLYSYPVNIANNCWCSNIESEISQSIYDAYDSTSLGIVTFTPFNSNCSSTALSTETFSNIKDYFSFYPNPAKDEINLSENLEGNYKIYSINGIVVKQGIVTKKINISELSKGLYIVKLSNKSLTEFSIKKLIKK